MHNFRVSSRLLKRKREGGDDRRVKVLTGTLLNAMSIAVAVIVALVNRIGDRISIRQVNHPDPALAGEGSSESKITRFFTPFRMTKQKSSSN